MRWLLIAAALASCAVAQPRPRQRAIDDYRCLGPEDAGRVMWWDGEGPPMMRPWSFDCRRYVCVDHGPERNGYWYEQVQPNANQEGQQ